MLNELVVVEVSQYQKKDDMADKWGVNNRWLTPIAGKLPNAVLVVRGTVAEMGTRKLEIGKTQLIMVAEAEADEEFGRQFNVTVLGDIEFADIMPLRKELGAGIVITTNPKRENINERNGTPVHFNTSGLDEEEVEEVAPTPTAQRTAKVK